MLGNWIRETTTTTGTGNLTLSSVSGYPTFNNVFSTTGYFVYTILDDTTGAPIETGIGHLSGTTTLVRDHVTATYLGGTYDNTSPSAVNLSAGTKRVICSGEEGIIGTTMPAMQGSFGSKIVLPDGLIPATSTKTLAANIPRAGCLYWDCASEITDLCCEVSTAAGSGTDRIQLGIYATKEDGTPGPLLARTGDIAPNSTGFKSATLVGGALRLLPGWYWWAAASNVAAALRAYNAGSPNAAYRSTPMGHVTNTINQRYGQFTLTTLSGGWTALDSSTGLASAIYIGSDFTPVVGAIVA